MEFKGTKGEWTLHHEHSPKLLVIKEDYSEDICECLLEADAKLISCAPELLNVVIELHTLLEEHLPNWYLRHHYNIVKKVLEKALD